MMETGTLIISKYQNPRLVSSRRAPSEVRQKAQASRFSLVSLSEAQRGLQVSSCPASSQRDSCEASQNITLPEDQLSLLERPNES